VVNYRIGWPFWRRLAKFGISLKLKIEITYDKDTNILIATSSDLLGLICEATTWEELILEINYASQELLSICLDSYSIPKLLVELNIELSQYKF
jgi:hypothetical protein